MTRLYANENFPQQVVERLRELGHDILTVRETGKAGIAWPDEQVLEFAKSELRVLVTLNRRHFIRSHSMQSDHAGIIACTFDPDFTALASRVHAALVTDQQPAGQLIRINRPAPLP